MAMTGLRTMILLYGAGGEPDRRWNSYEAVKHTAAWWLPVTQGMLRSNSAFLHAGHNSAKHEEGGKPICLSHVFTSSGLLRKNWVRPLVSHSLLSALCFPFQVARFYRSSLLHLFLPFLYLLCSFFSVSIRQACSMVCRVTLMLSLRLPHPTGVLLLLCTLCCMFSLLCTFLSVSILSVFGCFATLLSW